MPVKIPNNLPARRVLAGENIFVMTEERATHQEIRPLSGGEAQNCEYSGYHLLDYVGAGLRVDAVYEAGGRLNSFMLYTPDGGVIRYFGGEIKEE